MVQDRHSVLWRCATGSAQNRLHDLVRAHFLAGIFADHILHEGADDITRTSAGERSPLLSMRRPSCLTCSNNIRRISSKEAARTGRCRLLPGIESIHHTANSPSIFPVAGHTRRIVGHPALDHEPLANLLHVSWRNGTDRSGKTWNSSIGSRIREP